MFKGRSLESKESIRNLLDILFGLSTFSIPAASSSACWEGLFGSFNAGASWEYIVVGSNTPGCIIFLFTVNDNRSVKCFNLKILCTVVTP